MASTITSEIITALAREDDFGFEMQIGRDLRGLGVIGLRHGQTYVDTVTGRRRQSDFQCVVENGDRSFLLSIECKNAFRDSPIVVCGHQRVLAESFHDFVFVGKGSLTSPDGRAFRNGMVSEVVSCGPWSGFYPTGGEFVGKSVFRPKPPKPSGKSRVATTDSMEQTPNQGYAIDRDDGYDIWNQAVGSAAAAMTEILDLDDMPSRPYVFTLSLPIMVVPDEALWTIEYDANGELTSNAIKVDHVTLFVDHGCSAGTKYTLSYRYVRISHAHFTTRSGLSRLVNGLRDPNSSVWESAFPKAETTDLIGRFQP